VLLYHNIEHEDFRNFHAQIAWIRKSWNFITPNQFEAVMSNKLQLKEDSILLTFDDGFESNYLVAKEILSKYEIKAIFFVVTNFISSNKRRDIDEIINKKIFPDTKVESSRMSNMTWCMLDDLKSEGHAIGGHTRNHERLSSLKDERLKGEILGSFLDIKKNLGIEPKHFAYTFGNLRSFSPEALHEAKEHFKYIHTGLRGINNKFLELVARDAVDAKFSNWLIGSFLEGGADFLYRQPMKKMHKWI